MFARLGPPPDEQARINREARQDIIRTSAHRRNAFRPLLTTGLSDRPALQTPGVIRRSGGSNSSLINRMVGEERLLTGPEAGITRDSILVPWEWEGRTINLVDTAGIRRRARVTQKLEKLAVGDALRSIQYAEVVVLLLDATIPFEKQDLALADLVEREGRAIVINLPAGEQLQEHQVHEKAWLLVTDGEIEVTDGGDGSVTGSTGLLVTFEPNERHEVTAKSDARLLLVLSPWPGDGHPSQKS